MAETMIWGITCHCCRASFNRESDGSDQSLDEIEQAAGEAGWVIGLFDGQGHYACPDHAAALYDPCKLTAWRTRPIVAANF